MCRATTDVVRSGAVRSAIAEEIDVRPEFPEPLVIEIAMSVEKVRDGPIAGFPRQALSVPPYFRIGMKEELFELFSRATRDVAVAVEAVLDIPEELLAFPLCAAELCAVAT